jgi:CO/xanthine dehydrogenase Mo-binding subunit
METTEVIVKDEESYINEMIEKWLNAKDLLVVGKPILRIDSLEKALGISKYVNDYLVAGTLYARLIKAPVSSGILKGITHADIPGKNQVGYFIEDQPLFVDSIIHYHGEPLGLVVAETMSKADEARELVKVEYEERPGVYDPIKAMEQNAPLVHPERGSNIALKTKARKGDVNGRCCS